MAAAISRMWLVVGLGLAGAPGAEQAFSTEPAAPQTAASPPDPALPAESPSPDPLPTLGPTIDLERGEPNQVVDGIGWVFGIPNKVILLDSRVDNHRVSAETVDRTTEYLAQNDVDGVLVRVNQYDPLGEWSRLWKNDRVGLGWRLTVGSAYTLGYSLVPGRLFGHDWYNPFTDTVHVYSDVPALALEQAALAKDTRQRAHPGFYSAVRLVPFVGIVHFARAKQAVFEHVDRSGSVEDRAEARRVLQPQFGAQVGGQASLLAPQADAIFSLAGAAVGHAVGRYQASQIEDSSVTPATATEPSDESPKYRPARRGP